MTWGFSRWHTDPPEYYDADPPEDDEHWEEDMPDHWWADWDSEAQDEQYERSKPYELRVPSVS